jgi:hypothetical protein
MRDLIEVEQNIKKFNEDIETISKQKSQELINKAIQQASWAMNDVKEALIAAQISPTATQLRAMEKSLQVKKIKSLVWRENNKN